MNKKIATLLIGILAVAGLLAYVAGIPMWERRQEEKIRAALEKMPGVTAGEITVTFSGNKTLITNLQGRFEILPGLVYTCSIARIEATGLNIDAPKTSGVTTLADSLRITDMRLGSVFEHLDMTQDTFLKEGFFRDIRLNLAGLLQAIEQEDPAAVFANLATLHIGRVACVGYVSSMNASPAPLTLGITSMEAENFGMLQSGPLKMHELRADFGTEEVFTLKGLSLTRAYMPDYSSPLIYLMGDPPFMRERSPMILRQKLHETPMVIEGLALDGLSVKGPLQDPVLMDSFVLNLTFDWDNTLLESAFSNLVLPPSVLELLDNEFTFFTKAYGKPLKLSGNIKYVVEQKGDIVTVFVSASAADKNLGGSNAEVICSYEEAMQEQLVPSPLFLGSPLFHSGRLEFTDKGILTVLFDAAYLEESSRREEGTGPASGADIRRQRIEILRRDASQARTRNQAALLNGLADFVEKGGSLSITLTASSPVPLYDIGALNYLHEDTLTIRVEHTDQE